MESFPIAVVLIFILALAAWTVTRLARKPLRETRRALQLAMRQREELDQRADIVDAELRRVLALFEAVSEGIIQIGRDARFLHTNAAARNLLNLPAHPQGQLPAALIRHPELRELIERAARGEEMEPSEIALEHRSLLIAPQQLPRDYAESGAVISIVDLSELRRLESVRRDFVANVSHELKTPLTSIRGYTETLLSDDLPPDMRRQFLEVIDKNAARVQRIVDDLLDLSRLQSGGWQPNLETVDARGLALETWGACEDGANRKRIDFTIAGEPERVVADASGLRQVLSNLFDNAIRHTPPGGAVRLSVRRHTNGSARSYVELEVLDNGVGIPRESLQRVFERFYRVDPARSRAEGGTGLGLAIVKHLIERMGGAVTAESELGKGTAIRIRLPAASP